jgi:hypothetical protein
MNGENGRYKELSDDTVTIKSSHGKYVKAEKSGWFPQMKLKQVIWNNGSSQIVTTLKGSGPIGEFVLAGAILIPLMVLVTGGTGFAASVVAAGTFATASAVYSLIILSLTSTIRVFFFWIWF